MKRIVIIIVVLITFSVSAQKYKFKKNKVLFDKTEVANYTQENPIFTFTSLDNSKGIKVELKKIVFSKENIKQWYVISDLNSNKTTQIEFEMLKLTLSLKKAVVELLHKKYNIITSNGIANLDSFFSEQRPNLEAQYQEQLKQVENDAIALQNELNTINVTIDTEKKHILDNGEKIGSYIKPSDKSTNRNIYPIYDLDNRKVAIASYGSFSKVNVKLPYHKYLDQNEFDFTTSVRVSPLGLNTNEERMFVADVVKNLAVRGVTLGKQVTNQKHVQAQTARIQKSEALKAEKENSKNYYNAQAIVTSKDGQKTTKGEGSLIFEKLDSEKSSGMVSLDKLGNKVKLKVQEGEKQKYNFYKAADNVKVCFESTNKCYRGFKMKGIGGGATFKEIVKEDGLLGLYKSATINKYYIWKKGKENGLPINTESLLGKDDVTDKTFKKIHEYLDDCNTIKEYSTESIDLTLKEDLIILVDNYNSKCK